MRKFMTTLAMLACTLVLLGLGWVSFAQAAPATSTESQPPAVEYGQIRGRVLSGRTGKPLGGISVIARNTTTSTFGSYDYESTDASGFYTLSLAITGTYQLSFTVSGSGYFGISPTVRVPFGRDDVFVPQTYKQRADAPQGELINVKPGDRIVLEDMLVQTVTQLTGVVRSAQTGQPVTGQVYFRLYTLAGQRIYNTYGEYIVDGTYAIGLVPDGVYKLGVSNGVGNDSYYPNSATFEEATPITLTTGIVLVDHEIRLLSPRPFVKSVSVASAKSLTDTLLVVLGDLIPPLYSLDGGASWRNLATMPWTEPNTPGIAVVPTNNPQAPARFLLAPPAANSPNPFDPYTSTLYYTDDYGQNYRSYRFRKDVYPTDAYSCHTNTAYIRKPLFTSPSAPQGIYLTQTCIMPDPFGSFCPYLIKSTDLGVSWQPAYPDEYCGTANYFFAPTRPNRLYVWTGRLYQETVLAQSDDGGQAWHTTPYTYSTRTLVSDWSDSQRIYRIVSVGSPIVYADSPYQGQRSSDDGATWTNWAQMPCPVSFQQLVAAPPANMLFLRCVHGLFRSRDAGDSWEKIDADSGEDLTVDYGNPKRLFWSHNGELWASTDQGTTWQVLLARQTIWLPVVRR